MDESHARWIKAILGISTSILKEFISSLWVNPTYSILHIALLIERKSGTTSYFTTFLPQLLCGRV